MKKLISFAIIISLSIATAINVNAQVNSYYPFEVDYSDTKSGLDGYETDGYATIVQDEERGGVVQFSGEADSWIVLPAKILNTNTGIILVSVWAKWMGNSGEGWCRIFDFGSGTDNYICLTPSHDGSSQCLFTIKQGGTEEKLDPQYQTIEKDVWVHYAVTYDDNTGYAYSYINGELYSERAISVKVSEIYPFNPSAETYYLAKSQWPDSTFTGRIDDLYITDKAFTEEDILNLYQGDIPNYTTVSKKELSIKTHLATKDSFLINSNLDWEIKATTNWISANLSEDTGNQKIIVSIDENKLFSNRSGEIQVIYGETDTLKIPVTQVAMPEIFSVDKNNITISATESKDTIIVSTNVEWVKSITSDWITIDTTVINDSNQFLIFTVDANSIFDARSDTFLLVSELHDTLSVVINQKEKPLIFKVDSNQINAICFKMIYLVEVQTNIDFTISVDEEWISNDLINDSLFLTVEDNPSKDPRIGLLTIVSEKAAISVFIFQEGLNPDIVPKSIANAILVYPNPTKGIINLDLKNNSGYSILEICNLSGSILKTGEISGPIKSIDISDLPEGYYILNLKSNNEGISKIILKK